MLDEQDYIWLIDHEWKPKGISLPRRIDRISCWIIQCVRIRKDLVVVPRRVKWGSGYNYTKAKKKWKVQFNRGGKRTYLGYYTTEAEAKSVADKWKEDYVAKID